MTHALIALGHPVVAVDESPEMLAHVRGAETVCSPIQSLDLGREFPAVMLASNLINAAEPGLRSDFLASCRRHLAPSGSLFVERMDPRWATPQQRRRVGQTSDWGFVQITVTQASLDGDVLDATVEYVIGDRRLLHSFRSQILDDRALEAALAGAGLTLEGWLDPGRCWAEACRQ